MIPMMTNLPLKKGLQEVLKGQGLAPTRSRQSQLRQLFLSSESVASLIITSKRKKLMEKTESSLEEKKILYPCH
eukprot:3155774-Ditylum_brightwellii.AAC.1